MNFLTRLRAIILAAVALAGVGVFAWLQEASVLTGTPLTCSDLADLLRSPGGRGLAAAFYKHVVPPDCRPEILPLVRCWEIGGDPDTICRNGLLFAPGMGGDAHDPNTDLPIPANCRPDPRRDNPIPCHTDFDDTWLQAIRQPSGDGPGRHERNKYILRILREVVSRDK